MGTEKYSSRMQEFATDVMALVAKEKPIAVEAVVPITVKNDYPSMGASYWVGMFGVSHDHIVLPEQGIPGYQHMWDLGMMGEEPRIPFTRMVAFTTIHEMAHILMSKYEPDALDHHDSHKWAAFAQAMGIKEMPYRMKGPDWKYQMCFRDQALWGKIQCLASFPGSLDP